MNCYQCDKRMDRDDDKATTIKGVVITVKCEKPEDVDYMNAQLGRYSDGEGGCDVAICDECYIDTLFLPRRGDG